MRNIAVRTALLAALLLAPGLPAKALASEGGERSAASPSASPAQMATDHETSTFCPLRLPLALAGQETSEATDEAAPAETTEDQSAAPSCALPSARAQTDEDGSAADGAPAPGSEASDSRESTPEPGTPAATGNLTPERAVALALAGHPALRAADSNVSAAEAGKAQARSGYLPRVDLVEEWYHSNNPVFVFGSKLGQQRFGMSDFAIESLNTPDPYTNSATRVELRQNVWDAGRTHHYSQMASLGVESAGFAAQRARDEVAFGAVKAFWDAVLAQQYLDVARAAEEAASANAKLAHDQVEAGLAVPSDAMQAEVRLSEVRAMRTSAEEGVQVARAALREALGLRADADFDLAPPEISPDAPSGSPDAAVRSALDSRPDLQALDRRIDQSSISESVAKSRWLPEIGLGARYEWNAYDPFGNDGDNWSVGATLRTTIFDGTETKAHIDQARAQQSGLLATRDRMQEGIRVEVRDAWARCVGAAGRLKAAESSLDQSEEALRIVRDRYGEGMAVMVELLGAEAARTQAQGSRAQASRDLAVARAALDLATGKRPSGGNGREY